MTVLMDKFFVKIGFESQDIKRSSKRGFLYIGIIFMSGLAAAFFIMTIFS